MSIDWTGKKYREAHAYNTSFDKFALMGGKVRIGFMSYPAMQCSASITETGTSENKYFGGEGGYKEGLRTGGMIKGFRMLNQTQINNNNGWFILHTPNGTKRVKLKGDQFIKARQFVMNLQLEKERQGWAG